MSDKYLVVLVAACLSASLLFGWMNHVANLEEIGHVREMAERGYKQVPHPADSSKTLWIPIEEKTNKE